MNLYMGHGGRFRDSALAHEIILTNQRLDGVEATDGRLRNTGGRSQAGYQIRYASKYR